MPKPARTARRGSSSCAVGGGERREQLDFALAPDKWREALLNRNLKTALDLTLLEYLIQVDGSRNSLQRSCAHGLTREQTFNQAIGRITNRYGVGFRLALDSGSQIGRVA